MEQAQKPLGCVVLAAGSARRFGGNKLAASLDGRSLIRRALEAVPAEAFDRVVVVTQYPEIMRLAEAFSFSALHNDRPELGVSHSIQMGLTALRDCSGVLFQVADQPFLRRESVAALCALWQQNPENIAALASGGVRGNPCLFPARLFPALMALTGDTGGAAVIRQNPDALSLLEVDPRELADADTPETLAELKLL